MPNIYQVPPGGLTTWRAAQRLMGGMGAHHPHSRRRMRAYSRANPIYRLRGLRWLGDDSTPPDIPYPVAPLPTDLTPPLGPSGYAPYVPPPQVGPAQVPYTYEDITGTLQTPAQQAAASSPYTNVMSQIANALANTQGVPAGQQQRTILTPTPTGTALGNWNWPLIGITGVGLLLIVGAGKKGRR
jgi:hypothetical protein